MAITPAGMVGESQWAKVGPKLYQHQQSSGLTVQGGTTRKLDSCHRTRAQSIIKVNIINELDTLFTPCKDVTLFGRLVGIKGLKSMGHIYSDICEDRY